MAKSILATLGLFAASLTPSPPVLDDASFARWKEFLGPSKDECRFQEIPWQTAFRDGVKEAQKLDRPLLIWAMNGHPLACT